MTAQYTPRLVANAMLFKARQEGVRLTHLKVQKLVFFMHAWSLVFFTESVVSERPQAWQYGPVFDSLYHDLKGFGSSEIDAYLLQIEPLSGERKALMPVQSDSQFWGLLDRVWERYSSLSARQLSTITHEAGGPWEAARHSKVAVLPDQQVRAYYVAQLTQGKVAEHATS